MEEEEQRIKFLNEISLSIKNEDHTIMNPIKYAIQSDFAKMGVEFCGYTIPHPSESTCNLVIQMKDKNKQTPENLVDVTTSGIDHLIAIVDRLSEKVNQNIE
jgi:DNA-directed RNA polymerase I and III subunit RPAC2